MNTLSLHFYTPHSFLSLKPKPQPRIQCCSTNNNIIDDIDMVKTKQGTYEQKQNKVCVLWDLDNKPPRGPPYNAAVSLKNLAERFGDVTDISAYANRHAFIHLPQWVLNQRRERKNLDILERKGIINPPEPYVCSVCGRKCKTNVDLKKHFKQLHQRERQKKLNRLNSLKGKKRQKYKERFVSGDDKYNDAVREILKPKVGYGLASELRRAGVFVKTVEDKPQAADWALKKQMMHSMSRGIDWLFLVSDDSDFSEMLRKAREANLGTVVVGDVDRALGRHADLWVPWNAVENGEVMDMDLIPRNRDRRRTNSTSTTMDDFGDVLFFHEGEEMEDDFMLEYSDDDDFDEDSDEEDEDGFYIY
ncbi:putative transcription factor C2H2 family [Medicago truncatula]|uniref:C2H2 type zinc finger protein n=1 Tax=Medicago truncatula TaxID=3880 RepID=G7I9W5_MEDTR|nr:uncharacterized protein LOC11415277 [Medicago truncatula]AES59226.1 C2H2 type zinc finger protein [Medicago truncatula]RHN77112.1 putative transcription factor C2H2 family [Medicago truncatula]